MLLIGFPNDIIMSIFIYFYDCWSMGNLLIKLWNDNVNPYILSQSAKDHKIDF